MADIEQNICSPRKMRKFESLSQNTCDTRITRRSVKKSQESQNSRATSTPTKKNLEKTFEISLDLSSIHSVIAAPSERSFLTESFQNQKDEDDVSTTQSNLEELSLRERSSIYSGTSISEQLNHLQAPNGKLLKGKLWRFFKPKNEESLYFKIFSDFDAIPEHASDLLNEFETNKKQATLSLMKLFIDISGYQTFKIDKYFDFNVDSNISSKKVIKLMEVDLIEPELLEYKTYIFYEFEKGKSKLAGALAAAVQKFLETFFLGVHAKNLLFVDVLYKFLFNFLYHMCQSILRPIRHTGLVLVRILITIFNYILKQIMKGDSESDSESNDEDNPHKKKIVYVERYLDFFLRLFLKNSLIPDPHLAFLRAENIKTIGKWTIDYPHHFEKCFYFLSKLLIDESEVVRLNTLNVFESFLKEKSTNLYVSRYMNNIVEIVRDRLKDVSIKVVVAAIKIFTTLLTNYQQFISVGCICLISDLLYGDSYLYAEAAGSFMNKYLSLTCINESQLLHNLVEITTTVRFSKMKPLFIEAFSQYETVLKNYRYLVNFLITSFKNEPPEFSNNVMELIYYSVYQTLKGVSLMKRKHSIQASPLSSDHEKVAEVFLLNLKSLFELFQTEPIALNYLIKILCLIEYELLATSYHSHFIFMLKNCRQFFLKADDDELLESICCLFKYVCYDKNITLKDSIKGKLLDNLFDSMSGYLKGYLESDEEQQISLDGHFKKIGILYEKFNLNNYFEWNYLFLNWGKFLLNTGQITACTKFLIWRTEEMAVEISTGFDDLRTKLLYFKTIFLDYTKSSISVLTSRDATNDLKYKVFGSLCQLHLSCDRISLKLQEFDDVRFGITEVLRRDLCEPLTEFFKKNIVYDRSLLPETRKKYIVCWLNLVFNGLIDIVYIVPLFECYYIRSEEYGTIIEWISDKVYANNPEIFFNIILSTLGNLANELFGKERKSFSNPEAIELLDLAAKFGNMPPFKQFTGKVLSFIRRGMIFAFKSELLEFLVLLKNFIPELLSDRQQCSAILQEILPPEYEDHIYVKALKIKLKSETSKIGGKGRTLGDETLSSTITKSKNEELEMNVEPKLKKRRRSSISRDRSKASNKKIKPVKTKPDKMKKSKKTSIRKKQSRTNEDEDNDTLSKSGQKKK